MSPEVWNFTVTHVTGTEQMSWLGVRDDLRNWLLTAA